MTGEHLAPDLQELIKLFHQHGVRYLLIGGEAVIHHGYARLTGDIDFAFDQERRNCVKLLTALGEFWGGSVPAVDGVEDLLVPGIVFQFGRPPNRVDLLGSLGPVPFSRAWRNRVNETLDTGDGKVPLYIIGLDDLLTVKRAAGRHKDLDDVEHLEATAKRATRRAPRRLTSTAPARPAVAKGRGGKKKPPRRS
jgi:hypothetical protein